MVTEQELELLQADQKRLDFLDKCALGDDKVEIFTEDGGCIVNVGSPIYNETYHLGIGKNLREAIDSILERE